LRRPGARGSDVVGIFLAEVTERVGRTRPDSGGQYDHDRAGVLPLEQPLPLRQLVVFQSAPPQQVPAARDWLRRDPAAPVHLCAAAAGPVRQRSYSALGLAMALPRRIRVLPHRGGGEDDHPFVSVPEKRRNRGGNWSVISRQEWVETVFTTKGTKS